MSIQREPQMEPQNPAQTEAAQIGLGRRHAKSRFSQFLFLAATLFGILFLALLLVDVWTKGAEWLSLDFIRNFPSRFPERAGIRAALAGTVWVMGLMIPIVLPLGIGTAIYLEEYAGDSRLKRIILTNIANLAGVPSIIYGMLGLAIFAQGLGFGRSVLAGSATMALLVLPIVIVAAQEAIRAVPQSVRHASYALGATRWQTVSRVVLPSALPGIMTGMILALSRAIGETAPLIMLGALTYVARTPGGPLDKFTVMPIQIYNWTSLPKDEFRGLAAAAIIVLLVVQLGMNAAAILLRNRYQRKVKE